MLVELDTVNHALGEHANSARGGLYLCVLIHLLDCRREFVPLTYEGRDLFRYTKSARAALPRRGGAETTIQAKASMLPWRSSTPPSMPTQ